VSLQASFSVMNPSLFRYIWQHTRREQLWVIAVILISLPFAFMALDLPKLIVNGPIQGRGFATPDATARFLELKFSLPAWLGGAQLDIFDGLELGRMAYLVALSLVFLVLVCINGLFKYYINTYKGRLGERMLRRLRYELIDRVLRFPLAHFKKVKAAEVATMVKDEVEPLGGFIGDAFVQPVFLSGQALTAMVFILVQNVWLGLIATSIVLVQAFLIPRLRRRLLVLGKQQQLTARDLAGRVGEVVDGIGEVRTNDATNYERADIASRLGRIFFIRYELYQRKFFVKFLNNFLAQITPFLFFLIGGYFAIRGSLDIGQLVAVIAAYKDLPGPIKELIDWDQQRQDVEIKYAQVSEQFSPEPMTAPSLQTPTPGPVSSIDKPIEIKGLTVIDDTGAKVLEPSDITLAPGEWVAAVGEVNAGAEATAEAIAGLVLPSAGRMRIGDQSLDTMAESITGRRIAYVGPDTYLRNTTLRECLLYGLMNYPLRAAAQDTPTNRQLYEARAAGNIELDIAADWVDYERVGASDLAGLDRQILATLAIVELEDDIFEFGLRSSPQAGGNGSFEVGILNARAALQERLVKASIAHMVESFDPDRYQAQATIAENLVFGAALDPGFRAENLSANPLVLNLLAQNKLDEQLFQVGKRIAATVVELFADLPPDHPFFDRLSFVKPEELPSYKTMITRVGERSFAAADKTDRTMILGLALGYIEPRHRLNLLTDDIRNFAVEARKRIIERIGASASPPVAVYEPDHYNAGSSLEANILFGRITHGVADAAARVRQAVRETLLDLGLRDLVLEAGLSFIAGPAGKRLTQVQRQKIALARALLKQPDILIVNRGLGNLSPRSQRSIMTAVAKSMSQDNKMVGKWSRPTVFWVLASPTLVDMFDRVLVFREGRIIADGTPSKLLESDKHLKRLVA
jgi:putative ABC transport system ATP-binding protein